MFNFEKMNIQTFKQINEKAPLKEKSDRKEILRKLSEITAKHNLGEQFSMDDLYTIARKIFPNLSWSDKIRLSTNFLNACAELLFASEAEFSEKLNHLTLLFFPEIQNFPFHRINSEQTANIMLESFICKYKVDDKNRDNFRLAINLLMKLYTRHDSKCIDLRLRVHVKNFNMKLCAYPNNEEQISLSLFGYAHNKYERIMSCRPPNSTIIKCTICKLELDSLTTFKGLVILIAEEGIHCKCWQRFLEANPERNIHPCSAKGCDGSLCHFCDQYKEMQLMEFISVINDLFKDGSLSEDVYNDLFDTFCQIIIGGSSMPVMPLMTKLLFYLPSVSIELYQKLFHLIAKFEIFFRRMNCLPRPNFLSKPNLRDFTKADYDAYMDELKRGQEHFETDIPKLGFCCCNENIDYQDELNRRKARFEQDRHDEKVGNAAVLLYKRTTI